MKISLTNLKNNLKLNKQNLFVTDPLELNSKTTCSGSSSLHLGLDSGTSLHLSLIITIVVAYLLQQHNSAVSLVLPSRLSQFRQRKTPLARGHVQLPKDIKYVLSSRSAYPSVPRPVLPTYLRSYAYILQIHSQVQTEVHCALSLSHSSSSKSNNYFLSPMTPKTKPKKQKTFFFQLPLSHRRDYETQQCLVYNH